jgi:predicted RND superfamily exporter protein
MGLFDIPLDASSIMVGSIIIGLAVDDTIHILHRFRMEFESSGDTHQAVRETLRTTGTALFFTTLVLTTGFTTMALLGTMKNTINFGYLSALGIAIAFVANVALTPALVALTRQFQSRRALSRGEAGCASSSQDAALCPDTDPSERQRDIPL